MTIREILRLSDPLKALMDQKVSFQLAYKLSRIAEITDKNIAFAQEKYKTLVDQYKDPEKSNDEQFTVKSEYIDEFNAKTRELDAVEISEEIPKLKMDELNGTELTPSQVMSLMPIITE